MHVEVHTHLLCPYMFVYAQIHNYYFICKDTNICTYIVSTIKNGFSILLACRTKVASDTIAIVKFHHLHLVAKN